MSTPLPTKLRPFEAMVVLVLLTTGTWFALGLDASKFAHAIGPDPGDPFFNLAILRWVASRAAHGFAGVASPPFFFPTPGTLLFSDHLVGPAVVEGALEAAGLSPAAAYNTLLLAAFALSGLAAFAVLRRSGLRFAGALLAALAWVASPFRWSALSHLQVLLALFVPVTLWAFDRFLSRPTIGSAIGFLASYAAHLSGGSYLALMIHLPLAVLSGNRLLRRGRRRFDDAERRRLGVTLALAMLLGLVALLPYRVAGRGGGGREPVAQLASRLVTLASYASVGPRGRLASLLPESRRIEPALFPGVLPALLAVIGCVALARRRRSDAGADPGTGERGAGELSPAADPRAAPAASSSPSTPWMPWATALIVLGALAAGEGVLRRHGLGSPAEWRVTRHGLRLWAGVALAALVANVWWQRRRPVPRLDDEALWWRGLAACGIATALVSHAVFFLTLRNRVPGFDAIRVPGRFFVFTGFCIAAFAGAGFDAILARLRAIPGRGRLLAPAAAAIGILLLALEMRPLPVGIRWTEAPDRAALPPVYRWVADEPTVRAIVELPLRDNWREAERMYLQTLHGRPLVNGYSGYLPPEYVELVGLLRDFPDREAATRLTARGASHLVLHLDELGRRDLREWRQWDRRLRSEGSPWLVEAASFDDAVVYRIAADSP